MENETIQARQTSELQARTEAPTPTADEIAVLSTTERFAFWLVRRMNQGRWKRFWTYCQRHLGSLWIFLATYNLMNVRGLENVEQTDFRRPLILVANHRSFFDMYTVSSVLFRAHRPANNAFFSGSRQSFFMTIR